MEKLVLIDGNAIVHRAYHAIPKSLRTRGGEQTNAVYGFATTLIKVLEDLRPEYIACSFDLAGPTFRHEAFKEYKATRVKADQELYDQIPRIKELIKTFGISIYEKEGFEADDVIGTIVSRQSSVVSQKLKRQTTSDKRQAIYVVSGDKDIFQLVDDNVKVYNLKKGLSQTQIIDSGVIKKDYKLDPLDFIDLKALAGDPSDNIPGVPGIGAKTATDLIQRYDTLDKLYQSVADCLDDAKIISKSEFLISNKIKNYKTENRKLIFEKYADKIEMISKKLKIKSRILKLLIENKDQAFLSQHLATIHKDVPIDFDIEKCKFGDYDKGKLQQLFSDLGFQSLLRRFGKGKVEESKPRSSTQNSNLDVSEKDNQLKLL